MAVMEWREILINGASMMRMTIQSTKSSRIGNTNDPETTFDFRNRATKTPEISKG
jgi:hypothetical protein